MSARIDRRQFIKVSVAAGGGLLVTVQVPAVARAAFGDAATAPARELNAFVEIASDGRVMITAPCPEIGQGVRTALPMMVVEELGADWEGTAYRQASADARYGVMTVGGSDSVADYWEPLRLAGATAREHLKEAAAQRWGVPRGECVAAGGRITHSPSGRRLAFRELADEAATLELADDPQLTDPSEFELLGTAQSGVDGLAVATGRAAYGLDIRKDGMLIAVVERPPVKDARLLSFDASASLAVPGVRQAFEVEPLVPAGQLYGAVRGGVAILAEDTWSALEGRRLLQTEWEEGAYATDSSDGIRERFARRVREEAETVLRNEGDVTAAFSDVAEIVEAEYATPTLAHVPMEPINFTAHATREGCEAWGPTQTPRFLQAVLAFVLGLPREAVRVHPTLSGGGFGRRLAFDYGVEAALISRQAGVPVQVVWTREDDVRQDYYRTPSHHLMRAGITDGRIVSWSHHLATTSLSRNSEVPRPGEESPHPGVYDVQGAADLPYDIANIRVEYSDVDVGLQMGSWRSVSHSFNVFAVESFIDEAASAAGVDPFRFRLEMLGAPGLREIELPLPGRRGRPRFDVEILRRALEVAADRAGWGDELPPGRGRGIACCYYKRTYAAHVAEVEALAGAPIRVLRIVAVVDPGRVVNLNGARAQIEGAAMDGVATVLKWGIDMQGGRVAQSNFHDYGALRIDEAPAVEVHILASERSPSGLGEPPYPSVAPAITNAIFAAAGRRVRRLPVTS